MHGCRDFFCQAARPGVINPGFHCGMRRVIGCVELLGPIEFLVCQQCLGGKLPQDEQITVSHSAPVTPVSSAITKVTFTPTGSHPNILSWFGSSGGGLPKRPELKSSGRFLFWLTAIKRSAAGQEAFKRAAIESTSQRPTAKVCLATSRAALHRIQMLG